MTHAGNDDDDWETEADYDNKLTENEQRWGKNHTAGAIDMKKLIEETEQADDDQKKKLVEESGITGSKGYGGRYGVEKDRMDKSAMGHEYIGKVEKHASQKDYSEGFGGKFGIQTDRVDKSAVGFDYKSKLMHHDSQTTSGGFGGKFGIESDRMDKSAVGFQDVGPKIGTNYSKVKPDISGAKPSNFRNKFENLALHTEEDSKERLAQQKRLREEKDKFDRDQSVKEQSTVTAATEPTQNFKPPRGAVVTGRSDKISDVISVFNTPQVVDEKPAPKQQIVIPRAEDVSHPPDIIPSVEIVKQQEKAPEIVKQQEKAPEIEAAHVQPFVPAEAVEPVANNESVDVKQMLEMDQQAISEQELIEQLKSDTIEEVAEEQFILSPDDPGTVAFALYDYQAAADDEISFDPGDVITHIELIDEGWWKGLHQATVTYGLFPANYVQLKE